MARAIAFDSLAAAGIETLYPKGLDSMDFKAIHVETIRKIIEEAFNRGMEASENKPAMAGK